MITGIGGQDGSYLAELLLEHDYEVFGVVRRAPSASYENLEAIRERIELLQADVLDELSLVSALKSCRPHEVYNLASVSFVPMSWKQPVLTAEFAAVGVTTMLESIRAVDDEIRFYQASSSEIFGEPVEVPQTERTPLSPLTPYGVAKSYGHFITGSYRRRYGLHASSGILYNHESPRRPLDFVTRKVAHAAAGIKLGLQGELWLGNLDARRDWGFAGDYVRAMWLMLQQDEPGRLRHRHGRGATASESWSRSRSSTLGSTPRSTCTSTARSSAARRSCTTSSAIRPRRGSGSAGSRPSASRSWSSCSSTPTSSGSRAATPADAERGAQP